MISIETTIMVFLSASILSFLLNLMPSSMGSVAENEPMCSTSQSTMESDCSANLHQAYTESMLHRLELNYFWAVYASLFNT